jgi:hypothetical protein
VVHCPLDILIGQKKHRWVIPHLPTGVTYDHLTLKLLEPKAGEIRFKTEGYVPDDMSLN